jgi:hypothetical protein
LGKGEKVAMYLLSIDTRDATWKGRALLRDHLVGSEGLDAIDLLLSDAPYLGEPLLCEYLRAGRVAPLQAMGTLRLFIFPLMYLGGAPRFDGAVNYVDVEETATRDKFCAMQVLRVARACNFAESVYEAWPDGSVLSPWQNPRGRNFQIPALNMSLVPPEVDVFRLVDWPGPKNIVVTERGRAILESWEGVGQEWVFVELKKN